MNLRVARPRPGERESEKGDLTNGTRKGWETEVKASAQTRPDALGIVGSRYSLLK